LAFTRAKKFLWFVGSLETLEATGSIAMRQMAAFVRKGQQNTMQYKRFETQDDWKRLQLSKMVFSNPLRIQQARPASVEEQKTAPTRTY
jgi:cell division protein FtsL